MQSRRAGIEQRTDVVRLSIRRKLILFTVIPVVGVYSVLFALGVLHVSNQLGRNAQALLTEHAHHQASRLALLLGQVPVLAQSIGDLVVADPSQQRSMLYAHLIDGLRRTPPARAVAVAFGDPQHSAIMERGAAAARPLGDDEAIDHPPGWTALGDEVGFSRPIYRAGQPFGTTWVTVPVAEVYARLDSEKAAHTRFFVHLEDGTLLLPPGDTRPLAPAAASLPLDFGGVARQAPTAMTIDGIDYWLISARVPNHPWWITAAFPVDMAMAQAENETALFAAALLLSLLLIVMIIGMVAREITRPLKTLDDTVGRIAAGNFVVAPEVPTDDELGRLARAIGRMARHIADREYQLLASHQALEHRVAERTQELQQANEQLTRQISETRNTQVALRRATDQAQQANRAKSEFLSNISHELRTPLHGVLGYAQLLRRDATNASSQRENLDAIERCGQHLLTLINDILDLTRIEAGQMRVDIQPTDLNQLASDVCTFVIQRARQKGLSLRRELAADLPASIRTDAVKLRQVLLNLLGNAVKFTHDGEIVLSVSRAADNALLFVVSDSGEGIPEDKIEAIFEAFNQAREGQATDGTGLGLAISQRLIRLLGGGELRAESQAGVGSRFSFTLPSLAMPANGTPEGTGRARDAAALSGSPACSAAVIDADAGTRGSIAKLLHDRHYDVETFPGIDDARPRLHDKAFDVVVIDVAGSAAQLAAMAREIRTGMGTSQAQLVAIGSDAAANAAADSAAEGAGFDAILPRPFDDGQLLTLLDTLLTGSGIDHDPALAALRRARWPVELARATAAHINTATAMGDVASLFQVVEELSENPVVSRRDVERLAAMARTFDFDGLRRFAAWLRSEA